MSFSFEDMSCRDVRADAMRAAREIIEIDYVLIGRTVAREAIDKHGTVLGIVYGTNETIEAQALILEDSVNTQMGKLHAVVREPTPDRLVSIRTTLFHVLETSLKKLK